MPLFEIRDDAGKFIVYGLYIVAVVLFFASVGWFFLMLMGIFNMTLFTISIVFAALAYMGMVLYVVVAPGSLISKEEHEHTTSEVKNTDYDPNCHGTGRCQYCRGTGFNAWTGSHSIAPTTCKYCLGTGVCRYCRGSGGNVNRW